MNIIIKIFKTLLLFSILFSNSYAKEFDYYDYKLDAQNHDQIVSFCLIYLIIQKNNNENNMQIQQRVKVMEEYLNSYTVKYYHLLNLDNSKKIIYDFEKRVKYFLETEDRKNFEQSVIETSNACLIVLETFNVQ